MSKVFQKPVRRSNEQPAKVQSSVSNVPNPAEVITPQQLQRAVTNPSAVKPEVLMELSHSYGNKAVQRLLQKPSAKPTKNTVQRLNTDDVFYTSEFSGPYGDYFLQKSEVKVFLNLLDNYSAFYSNTADVPTIGAMDKMVKTLRGKADDLLIVNQELRKELLAKNSKNKQNRTKVKNGASKIQNIIIHTLLDDISQEISALQKLATDQTYLNSGLDIKTALSLVRAGIAYNQIKKDTDLLSGPNVTVRGKPEVLGGGQMTPVTKLTYQGGEDRVFKPNENQGGNTVAYLMGKLNVQSATRVVAVGRVQALIEQKLQQSNNLTESLLGKIDPALYTPQGGNKPEIGTVTDFAGGMEGLESDLSQSGNPLAQYLLNVDFNDVKLKRQVYNLQLMDIIVGQVDRHMGNIKVDQALQPNQNTKITGIDNDYAFPGEQNIDDKGDLGKTRLPDLVDQAFAQAILAISDKDFSQALKGLRLVEKSFALQRLDIVKQKLTQLQGQNQLIAMPGQPKQPGQRDWGQIGKDDFHQSTGRGRFSDYMAQLAEGQIKASEAIKKDPTNVNLQPKQINRKNKMVWVIEYDRPVYLMARDQVNGSDLWNLYNEAVAAATPQNQQQDWNKIAVNKPQQSGFKLGGVRTPKVNTNAVTT